MQNFDNNDLKDSEKEDYNGIDENNENSENNGNNPLKKITIDQFIKDEVTSGEELILREIHQFLEHFFRGGNGIAKKSSCNRLINFLNEEISLTNNLIIDSDFDMENDNDGIVYTDFGLIKMMLQNKEPKKNQEDMKYQSLNNATIGKNPLTRSYMIMEGSILSPVAPSVQKKVIRTREKMLEEGYISGKPDGECKVTKTYIFPVNTSKTLIASIILGYNTNGKKKIII